MLALLIALGCLFLLVVAYFIAIYNRLVRLKQLIANSWSNIDTELKRRYDLIPNLVETVKGYAKHEREVFERVIEARNRAANSHGSPQRQASDENSLVGALRTVFAVAESYPDLKSSRNFLALQDELVNTENRIQAARRFYNGNVRDMNTLVAQFPSNLIASQFDFQSAEFFEIEHTFERNPVSVGFRPNHN